MSSILEKIVLNKREEILSLPQVDPGTIEVSDKSFRNVLASEKIGVIAEIKLKSPSAGKIINIESVTRVVEVYNKYADAISVVTDTKFFGGSFNLLKQIRKLTNLPILCKEFIISEKQIYLARKYGANAILLILSILSDQEFSNLFNLAKSLKLDILVEVSSQAEMMRVNKLDVDIIGVNNRNLVDFSIDIKRSANLFKICNKDCIKIAESGFNTKEDVFFAAKYVDAILIGTGLLKAKDPELKLKKLFY